MRKLIELDAALNGVANLLDYEIAKGYSGAVSRVGVVDMLTSLPPVDAVPREIEQANKQAAYVRGYKDGQKDKYGRWIDAVPIQHGRWINEKCNKCGGHAPFWAMATTYYQSNYCPNCGAKMDEKDGDKNG